MKVFRYNDFLCSKTSGYEFLLFNTVVHTTSGTSLSSFASRAAWRSYQRGPRKCNKRRRERKKVITGADQTDKDKLSMKEV